MRNTPMAHVSGNFLMCLLTSSLDPAAPVSSCTATRTSSWSRSIPCRRSSRCSAKSVLSTAAASAGHISVRGSPCPWPPAHGERDEPEDTSCIEHPEGAQAQDQAGIGGNHQHQACCRREPGSSRQDHAEADQGRALEGVREQLLPLEQRQI